MSDFNNRAGLEPSYTDTFTFGSDQPNLQVSTDFSFPDGQITDDYTDIDFETFASTNAAGDVDPNLLATYEPVPLYPSPSQYAPPQPQQNPYFLTSTPARPRIVVPEQPMVFQAVTKGAPLGHPYALYHPDIGFYYSVEMVPKYLVRPSVMPTPVIASPAVSAIRYEAALPSFSPLRSTDSPVQQKSKTLRSTDSPVQQKSKKRKANTDDDDNDVPQPKRKNARKGEPAPEKKIDCIAQFCTCKLAIKEPPRPANKFILYRQQMYPELMKRAEANARAGTSSASTQNVSTIAGEAWRNESAAVRNKFEALAKQAAEDHAKKYPDYKYRPVRDGLTGRMSRAQQAHFGGPGCTCGAYAANLAKLALTKGASSELAREATRAAQYQAPVAQMTEPIVARRSPRTQPATSYVEPSDDLTELTGDEIDAMLDANFPATTPAPEARLKHRPSAIKTSQKSPPAANTRSKSVSPASPDSPLSAVPDEEVLQREAADAGLDAGSSADQPATVDDDEDDDVVIRKRKPSPASSQHGDADADAAFDDADFFGEQFIIYDPDTPGSSNKSSPRTPRSTRRKSPRSPKPAKGTRRSPRLAA